MGWQATEYLLARKLKALAFGVGLLGLLWVLTIWVLRDSGETLA